MSRLLRSTRRPWMVALFAILAASIALVVQTTSSQAVQAPTLVSAPTVGNSEVSFNIAENKSLTVTPGTWTDSPTSVTYEWYRCTSSKTATSTDPTNCQLITGETGTTHMNTMSDVGFYILVKETATNAQGSSYTYSATTTQVRRSHPFAAASPALCHIRAGNVYCAGGGGTTFSATSLWANTGTGVLGRDYNTWQGPQATYEGVTLTDVISLEGSRDDMCALTLNGSIYCTGMNYANSLADGGGSNGQRTWFTRMKASAGTYVTGAVDIAVGTGNICFSKSDGTVWCTGTASQGATGGGVLTSSTYPTQVLTASATPLTGVIQIAGGPGASYASTFCAISTDGTTVGGKLYCWGSNSYGAVGDGTTSSRVYATAVTVNSSTTGFSAVATGDGHTCAIQNSRAWCWGSNGAGELGTGSTATNVLAPVTPSNTAGAVSFSSGVVGVYASDNNASNCFVKQGGATYCSGTNTGAQLNTGDSVNTTTAKPSVSWTSGINQVDIGVQFSCAFNPSTNTISCSGSNNGRGAWGQGNTTSAPTTAATLTNIVGLVGPNSVGPIATASTLTGNNNPGDTISDTSTWTGFPKPTLSYQWYQCSSAVTGASSVPGACNAISSATSATYTVQAGDVGSYISAFVTATNTSGSTSTMLAQPNAVGLLPITTSAPVVTAAASSAGIIQNTVISLTDPTWGAANPTGTASYAWFRCSNSGTAITSTSIPADCSVITGANSSSYTITKSEFGFYVRGGQSYLSTAGITYALSATTNQVRPSTSISASDYSMCAMRYSKIYCWGYNQYGIDGRSSGATATRMFNPTPSPVVNSDGSEMSDVVQFVAGQSHACAVKANRSLWCWGSNTGSLGTGSTTPSYLQATKVTTNDGNWAMVAVSSSSTYQSTCAIDVAGAVWCSSNYNGFGMAGDASSVSTTFKKSTTLTTGFIQIFGSLGASADFCALRNTGAVYCWGLNTNGQVGNGATIASTTASIPAYLDSGVTSIDMSYVGSCAIKRGALWCWGQNDQGALGITPPTILSPFQPFSSSADVSGGLVSVSLSHYVAAGYSHTCVLKYTGAVACSGSNDQGALNMSVVTNTSAFTATRWTSGVTDLGLNASNNAGYTATCAVKTQALYCAGGNYDANLALGTHYPSPYVVANGPVVSPALNSGVGILDVAPGNPAITTSQNYSVGQLVTSTIGKYDAYPAASVSYQWYSCSASGAATTSVPGDCAVIASATSGSYTVQAGDNGTYLRLGVTLTNTVGTSTSISAASRVGTAPTVAATPTGTIATGALKPLTGTVLTAPNAPVFSGDPTPNTSTQWYHCYQSSGAWTTTLPTGCYPAESANGSTYTTNHSDDGFFMLVAFSGTSSAGSLTYYSPTTARVTYSNKIAMSGSGGVCVIKNGKVYCWGHQGPGGVLGSATVLLNSQYSTGTGSGDIRKFPTAPVKLASGLPLSDVISISMGLDHACAVTYQGGLYCWGYNAHNELGDGVTTYRYTAAPVLSAANTPVTGVTQVAAGYNNTCAIVNNSLVCWGSSTYNVVGSGKTYATGTITNLTTNVQQVTMGDTHVCAISNAALRCFGGGNYGALGDGGSSNNATPSTNPISAEYNGQTVSLSGGVTNVTAGYATTCAVKLGKAYCWGGISAANLGVSPTVASYANFFPVLPVADGSVNFESAVISVHSGVSSAPGTNGQVTCAIKVGGSAYCAGEPRLGAGSGTAGSALILPTLATNLTSNVSEMAVGGYETCAIKSNQVYCAGSNGSTTNTASNTLLDGSSTAKTTHQLISAASSDLGISESAPTGSASITGYVAVGNTITATPSNFQGTGVWQGLPLPTMTQQWYICNNSGSSTSTLPDDCTAISNGTATTTVVVSDQSGKYFRVGMTGTNTVGSSTVYSATLGPVGPAPTLTSAASINNPNSPAMNSTTSISGNPATFGGSTAAITVTAQWYRCLTSGTTAVSSAPSDCSVIPGATSDTYKATKNDIGAYLRYSSIGTSPTGQVTSLSPSSAIVMEGAKVALTATTTCAVKLGRVYCWGKNTNLLLGTGNLTTTATVTTSSAATPVKKDASTILENVVDIQGRDTVMCAIDTSGALYCWGTVTNGRLGTGSASASSAYAVTPSNASDGASFSSGVIGVTVSQYIVCAWKSSGTAYCWGANSQGGLGNGAATTATASTPVPVSNLSSVSLVSAGTYATCGINSGAVLCWGSNNAGAALDGANTSTYSLTPTVRSVLTSNVTSIVQTQAASCAVMNYGVYCWGMNSSGQQGAGDDLLLTASVYTGAMPLSGALSSDVAGVYSMNAGNTVCAIKIDQTLWCWGSNSDGALPGLGKLATGYYRSPVQSNIGNVTYLTGENTSPATYCLVASNAVTCTGNNANNQMGNGNTTNAVGTNGGDIPAAVNPAGFGANLGADYVATSIPAAPVITASNALFTGSVLTVPANGATGFPIPSATVKWVRCTISGTATDSAPSDCTDIAGATGNSYTLTSGDSGYRIRAVYLATNSVNSVGSYSAATEIVTNVSVRNFARPIGGADALSAGETLTRTSAIWRSTPIAGSRTAGWLRCGNAINSTITGIASLPAYCEVITGQTGTSYTITAQDTGNYIAAYEATSNSSGTYYAISPTSAFVLGALNTVAISANNTCAIKTGYVYCGGLNTSGQLGNNSISNPTTPFTPSQVLKSTTAGDYLGNVVSIFAAKANTDTFCAITSSAQLWCWGQDSSTYQWLSSSGANQKVAIQPLGSMKVASGGINLINMCAITEGATGNLGGALYCWGAESVYSALGDGGTGVKPATNKVLTIPSGVSVYETGDTDQCAIVRGALTCWGGSWTNNKALPNATVSLLPTVMTGFSSGVTKVSLGGANGCAIQNGALYCWGANNAGQRGNGTTGSNFVPATPSNAADGTSFASGVVNIYSNYDNNAPASSLDRFCAQVAAGGLYCWGNDESLGLTMTGTAVTTVTTPKAAASLSTGVTSVALGYKASCAVKSGSLYCTGTSNSTNYGRNLGLTGGAYNTPTAVPSFTSPTLSKAITLSPTVPASAALGVPVNADVGSVTGYASPTFAFTWYVCDSQQLSAGSTLPSGCSAAAGSGATSPTYLPTSSDFGKYLLVKVVATNSAGSATSFTASTAGVSMGDQSVAISGSTGQISTGATLQLSASSSSGLTDFTWSSADSLICTVDSTGLVTALSGGHCVITATQAGTADYSSASASVDMLSARGNQTITWPNMTNTKYSATPITLAATTNSGLPITYASSTPSVCTVSGSSLTTVDLGSCTLTADQSGNAGFFPAPQATITFDIVQATQTITLASRSLDLTDGTYTLAGSTNSGLTISYSTASGSAICSVSGTTLTLSGPGNCVVTASQSGNTYYAAATNVSATYRILSTPVPDSEASISGTPTWGVDFVATPGVWMGAGTVTIATQWYACDNSGAKVSATGDIASNVPADCTAISGATSATFTPTEAQIGKKLRFSESASNVISGTTNYYTVVTAASSAVVKQSQTITFGSLTGVTYGASPITLTATSSRSKTITYASSNSSVCTISGSTLTVVGAGSCDVTASQTGDATTLAATDVIQTLTVAKASQTITLPTFTAGTYGGSAKNSGATSTSGLTVTLTSADTSICTVSGLDVNIVAPGTCSITASQAGDTNYNAATSVTKTFTISKAAQTITFAPTTKQKPAGDFAAGGSSSSGLTVSYSSSTTSVCTVSGSTISPVGLGTCTIVASQAGDSNYNAATSVTASFTIESVPVQTTAISIASAANYRFGTAITTTAGNWTGTATVAISRSWYRCDTAPSISSGTGSAAALAPSDCSLISGAVSTSYTPVEADITKYLVIAETASNTTSTGSNSRTTFVSTSTAIEKQTQTITFGALANAAYNDTARALTATSNRSLTISYSSSNTSVCTVNGSTLTVVAPGTCDVTASQAGNTTTLEATPVTQTLTVTKAAQTITLPNFTAAVYGDAAKVSGATASSGLTVTLTSADTAICTVSGLSVNIVAPGTCSITASQAGDTNYNTATSVTKTFTISKASQTITFAPTTKQKPAGDFAAGGSASSGLAVSYSSSTTSVCTVSGSTISPVGLGTCTITASQAGDSNWSAASDVTASFTIESVPVQSTAVSINSAATYRFGVAVTITAGTWSGTTPVVLTYSWYRCDTAASISAITGSASALKPSDCIAFAGVTGSSYTPVAGDVGKYIAVAETATNTTSAGTNVRTTFVSTASTVEKQTQTITFNAITPVTYTPTTQNIVLAASSDRGRTITYTSSDTSVCTISGWTLTVVAAGSCDVTASQGGDAGTLAATSVTRTLTINKANQTVSLNNLSAITFRGTPTTLVYSASSTLPVTVTSNDTSVCTVSGTTVSVVAVGTCSITASQAGDTNYNAATSVTKTFVISKAQDTLTFSGGTKQFRSGNFTISASTLSGASVSFASTTTSICTVSGTTVTPVAHGACVITATAATDSNYLAPANVNATFTIERAVEQTAVHSMTSFTTYWYDQQISYTAGTWVGSGTVTVTHSWYICDSRPTTIVVSANTVPTGCTAVTETSTGAYKPVAADIGKFVVLAETASNVTSGGTNTAKSWISATGVVTKWSQNLTFGALATKTFGDQPFALTATSDQGQDITYTSSDTSVCTVAGSTVTIVAAGSCDITASQAGTATIAAAAPITRTLTVNKANQTINFASLPDVTYTANEISISPSSTSNLPVVTTSNDTSVCTIGVGTVSLLKAGTCSITVSQAGNDNYNAATSVTRTFQVAKASQTISFTLPQFSAISQQGGIALEATTTSGLTITYLESNLTICEIRNGRLYAVTAGDCEVTASQLGDDRFDAAFVHQTVTFADYPAVDSIDPIGSLFTNSTSTGFTITFSEAVTGFDVSDLRTVPAGACTIGTPELVNGSTTSYNVALTNCAVGAVRLKLVAASVSNGFDGPVLDAVSTSAVTIDTAFTGSATVTPDFVSPTNRTTLNYNVVFAESVTGFDAADIAFTGTGSADCQASVSGTGASYVVAVTGCADGTVVLKVNGSSVTDLAGNVGPSAAVSAASVTVDLTAPTTPEVTDLPVQFTRSADVNANFTVDANLTYHCELNGVALTGCDGSLVIPTSSQVTGTNTLEVWATDAAGNNSTHYSHSWTVGNYARPSTPVFGTFTRTTYNHLTLTWATVTAGSSQLPVSGLRLEYSTNNGTDWTAVPDLAANATSYDFTVQSGTSYSFRIRGLSGAYLANAGSYSSVGNYVAVYQPTVSAQSTSAALLKPVAGSVITLTGNDLRDYSVQNPSLTAGTVVTITDSASKSFVAELVSVTATSIRFKVPAVSKIGAATIKVTVGAGDFQRTSANRNLNIIAKKVNQVISFAAPTSTRIGDADIQLAASMDSLVVPTYAIEPSSLGICSVSTTGLLHAIKGGVCAYKVTAAASDAFNAFTSAVYNTTVNKMNVSIAFDLPQNLRDTLDLSGNTRIKPDTYQLAATPDANIPNTQVKITGAPETTCFVDATYVLHLVGVGVCTVSALAENDYYKTEVAVTRTFTLIKNDQTLTYIAPGTALGFVTAPEATDATSGFQLMATLDSGLIPNFEAADSTICTVDAQGNVAWVGDLVKFPTQVCSVTISQPGDANFNAITPQTVQFTARHVPPQAPVGGYIVEPDGSLAVGRSGGLAASGGEGVAVVVVSGSKITITPFSKGLYIGPITAKVTIPYYVRVRNVATLKEQVCTIKFGILKKYKVGDPNAFKLKDFPNKTACTVNKDALAYFKEGNRLLPTIVVQRDRRWPTTYLAKTGSNGKGAKIWPRVKTWHLTIG